MYLRAVTYERQWLMAMVRHLSGAMEPSTGVNSSRLTETVSVLYRIERPRGQDGKTVVETRTVVQCAVCRVVGALLSYANIGNAEEGRKSAAKRKEEDVARKKELEQKQKEEAAKQKKDLEEKRRQEQRSTLAIRRIIQKVRLASPETFEEVQKELQEILRVELENTGSQKERIKEESEKGLEQAMKRLDSIREQRQKELDKKEAEDKKRQEQQAKTDELLKELSELVEAAEIGVARLKELAAPLSEKIKDSVKEVEACALAVEEAGSDAKTATKACTDFIMVNGNDIKDSAPIPAIPGVQVTGETKQALGKLLQRINECGKTAESLIQAARGAKEQAVRRAFARQKTKEMEAMFAKYDRDKDNALSQAEVAAYAKKEMSINVDKALLDKVWRCTVDADEKGVSFEKMYLLNASIGIVREMQRNERRKAARIAKERVLAGLREKVRAKVREADRFALEFEKELRAMEKIVAPLFGKAKTAPVSEMEEEADRCDSLVKACRDTEEKMRQRVRSIPLGFDKKYEDDLREFVKIETKPLESRMGRADLRLVRATNLTRLYREQGWRRRAQELEVVRSFAMKVARQFARLNKLSYEELFGHVDSDGDGALDEEEFISFFSTIDKDVKEEEFEPQEVAEEEQAEPEKPIQVAALEEADSEAVEESNATNNVPVAVAALDQEAAGRLQAIQAIMLQATPKPKPKPKPVVKAELTAEELKSLFRNLLEPHEVKISREVFLRIVKAYYKVVKETPMTEKLEVNGSQTVHQLKVGEDFGLVLGCPCSRIVLRCPWALGLFGFMMGVVGTVNGIRVSFRRPLRRLASKRSVQQGAGPSAGEENSMVHSGLNKLNAAAVHGHIGRADSIFHQLRSDIPAESRRTWHNTRLKACANAGSADLAVKYFEEMLEEGIAPNGRTFGKLMEAATKQTNRQEAQRWFRAHTNAHGQVQGLHIHMLVDAAAREGDFRAAEAWFRRFSTDTVLAPNIWEALLCSAARAGDAELAEELFLESTKAQAHPSHRTLAVVAVATLHATEGHSSLERWFDLADGLLCPEDKVASMAHVAAVAAKMGYLEVAQDLLQRLLPEGDGISPRTDLDGPVHSACFEVSRALALRGRPDQLDAAEAWVERGGMTGSQNWLRRICLELVKIFASLNHLSRAERMFLLVQQAGAADLHSFCIVVNACSKCGDLVAAERWFENALDASIRPDIVLFTSVSDAASRKGDMKAAEYWHKRATSCGLRPSSEMFGVLVSGEVRNGNLPGAERWAALAEQEYGPNLVILNSLIVGHAKGKDMSAAERILFRNIVDSRLQPDERSFGPLINAYAEQGCFSDALRCFRAMSSHQLRPSVIQYNQILKACARSRPRLVQEALEIFDELMKLCDLHNQHDITSNTRPNKLGEIRDLLPTRITLKTLGRCVGARRLSHICQEYGIDQRKVLGARFSAEEQKRASSIAERWMFAGDESSGSPLRAKSRPILEMLEGPEKETSLKVFRARGKVVGDENDKEGWVTIAGNQGTIFLQEGGHLWKVLRQSELSETMEDDADRWQLGREPESLAEALQDQRDFILRIFHRITDFRRSWYWLLFCFVVVYHTCVCSTELLTELDPAY
ncbi:P67 [Symbiodinium necroappetens]|uniref:P67 protein n=1 Tax=Symbiodinium necroappetens TaxID=1628268 RepID=A0A812JGG9_9DINO|nr:P67 [Symbiodinium necroappetens]